MAAMIDNLIAYRVLSMLVKPFNETEAYKLGIIDDTGKNLIKARTFKTTEQKNAYTYLHRLVFNLKKLLNKLPGGESKLKNIVAAFFLIKEAYATKSISIDEQKLIYVVKLLDEGVVLAQEQLVVDEFMLFEDIANVTGAGVSTDAPVIRKPKRFARFAVNDDVFKKFDGGKAKYRKWSQYLNLEDEGQRMIYTFAKKNPNSAIILHNGKQTKTIQLDTSPWSKTKRPAKQINNDIL